MENLLKLPYAVFNDWDLLQQFLDRRGNPRYELVGDVKLPRRKDIFDLGNLVRVDGNLNIYKTSIKSLENLEYVGGDLNLAYSSIQSLGALEYVGDDLDLSDTPIQSLGNLKFIGGRLYLSRNHQIPQEELNKFNHTIW